MKWGVAAPLMRRWSRRGLRSNAGTVTDPSLPDSSAAGAPRAPGPTVRRFGRLELVQIVGKSERSMTWLARDPRHGQELHVMLPRRQPATPAEQEEWQRRVRAASRLQHPALAHVVEIDTQDRWPYVSVDRELGETWAERLRRGTPPAAEAVDWACQLLEGLAFAHDAGLLHRDLQLHNLLIDAQGRVRILGLEVAGEPVAPQGGAPAAQALWTTDGELQPVENLSGRERSGLRPTDQLRQQRESAARDLLMCGVLLHRLLSGAAPLDEADVAVAADRLPPLGRDLLRLPWTTAHPIPEPLRAIVNRSTDRQPARRYFTARSLLRALDGWRESHARSDGGALHLMLDRLQAAGGLPARGDMQARVARITSLGNTHGRAMAGELLMDVGLSFELLRLVNTARAKSSPLAGTEPILTLRRAIAMVGLTGVQRASLALRPWPGHLDARQAQALDQAMEQARVAAGTAVRLRPAGYDAEVVYLLALLQNLGRLLLRYHFPDEAVQIAQLMQPRPATDTDPAVDGMGEQEAACAVLGVDIDSIALAVARHWGLNDEVQNLLRRLPLDKAVHLGQSDGELLRAAASAGNEAVDALQAGDPNRVARALARVVQRYGRALGFAPRDLQEAIQAARTAVRQGRADVDFDLTRPATLFDEMQPAGSARG